MYSDESSVLIGIPSKPKSSIFSDSRSSKIGGVPIWHDSESSKAYLSKCTLNCKNCSIPLSFIAQIYAPTEVIHFY